MEWTRIALALGALAQAAAPGPGRRSEPAQKTSADALKRALDAGEKVLVIDVRSDEEVRSGTVPGAIHIPLDALEARMKEVPKNVQLVFT